LEKKSNKGDMKTSGQGNHYTKKIVRELAEKRCGEASRKKEELLQNRETQPTVTSGS